MHKVLMVFGTRPEAIKMVPVYKALEIIEDIEVAVAVTGQHRQMLDQVLDLFGIIPRFDLDLMKPSQALEELTSRAVVGLTTMMKQFNPCLVLVHGDTTTTFSAALAAFYLQIPVAHVEAGLRTYDIHSPWPEEFNRRGTSLVSKLHFAPTEVSAENLIKEGIDPKNVFITGNTVIDTLLEVVSMTREDQNLTKKLDAQFEIDQSKKLILVTGHRRENFGKGFQHICDAILRIAERDDVQIIYPVHLNPSVADPVKEKLGNIPNVRLIPPQEYVQFVYLMSKAYLILSDSGGIQEEAPSLDKPVLVMRDVTERPEALKAGCITLVGTDCDLIVNKTFELLDTPSLYLKMSSAINPYGDGNAATKIAEAISKHLIISRELN